MKFLRERESRQRRLEPERAHVFRLEHYANALRQEREYREKGHTGVTLVKTDDLCLVLEALDSGERMSDHVVDGPAVVQVLDGRLEIAADAERLRVEAGDVALVPRGERRTVTATQPCAFLLTLGAPA